MENEYLNTDVRAVGGNSASNAWNRGYYLSTSIEGSMYNYNAFSKSALNQNNQVLDSPNVNTMEIPTTPDGQTRDINSYVNYDIPREAQQEIEEGHMTSTSPTNKRDYQRQHPHVVYEARSKPQHYGASGR